MLYRASIGDLALAVECDSRFANSVQALIDRLRRLNNEGVPLRAGSRIRYGWSILTLRAEGGSMRLCEPDFDADPVQQIRSTLDTTLAVVEQQTTALHRSGLTGMNVLFSEDVFVRNRALEAPNQFLKRQVPAGDADSGWYIGNLERIGTGEPDDTYEIIQVFQLLRRRPAILQALLLPIGYVVVVRNDAIAEVLDNDGKSYWH